jgi:mitochondrial fission protein ELM1
METTNHPAPLHIWRLLDGKPGHEKQSLGLVLALSKLKKVTYDDIKVEHSVAIQILQFLQGRFPLGKKFKKPNLIIGAGHRTHFSILAAKRAYGGKSIVQMKPSLPYFIFDLCLVPEHDNPPKRANIISTIGALNPLGLDGLHEKKPSSNLILIGGPSPHYKWDNNLIIKQIEQILKKRQKRIQQWVLTTSPRTPKEFIEKLQERKLTDLKIYHFEDTKPGWVEEMLLASENAWVTPDSISMVYEALSANCNVGVLELKEPRKNDKVARNILLLKEERYILDLEMFAKNEKLSLSKLHNQAEICASVIAENFF